MRKKPVLMTVGRVTAAAILAYAGLTGFCFFYWNEPPKLPCSDGVTDSTDVPNEFLSEGTEGFAWGRTNNEGYTNEPDYTPGMNIDVLIMGSSNVRARHVGGHDNMTFQLQQKLPDKTIYNIGMDAHRFIQCVKHLSAAVQKYKPKGYVVIETRVTSFTKEELEDILYGQTEALIEANRQKRLELYQKLPLLIPLRLYPRLLSINYRIMQNVAKEGTSADDKELQDQVLAEDTSADDKELQDQVLAEGTSADNKELLDQVLAKIGREVRAGGGVMQALLSCITL